MSNVEISSNSRTTNMRSKVCHFSFGFRHSFVIRHSCFVISMTSAVLSIFAEPTPSAKDILDAVRMIASRQQIDLQGQLRQDDVLMPFRLVQNAPLIRHTFAHPDETLEFRLGGTSPRVELASVPG